MAGLKNGLNLPLVRSGVDESVGQSVEQNLRLSYLGTDYSKSDGEGGGGGGWGKKQKKIHARENAKKKNSCKEEGKEKNSCRRKVQL